MRTATIFWRHHVAASTGSIDAVLPGIEQIRTTALLSRSTPCEPTRNLADDGRNRQNWFTFSPAIGASEKSGPWTKRRPRGRDDAKEESFQVQFHEDPEVPHYFGDLPIGLDEIEA